MLAVGRLKFLSRVLVTFLLLGQVGTLLPLSAMGGTSDPMMVVIVSPSTNTASISLSTLRAIYSMRLHRWPDGTPVRVFVMQDDSREHVLFSKQVLQVLPHQLRQAWDKLVFSGLGQYPQLVASQEEMLDKVASTPGAIGYVSQSEVSQNVRILQVR